MANLRDTEDGINEAGWEAEMAEPEPYVGDCERCADSEVELTENHIDNGENGSEWLCTHCYQKRTGTGAYDPENRDWDAVRDEQDGY